MAKEKNSKPQEKKTEVDGMLLVSTDLDWYKEQVDRLHKIVFFLIPIGFAVVILFNLVFWVTKPNPEIIAVSRNFRFIPLVPLDKPYVTTDGLTAWAAVTMEKTMGLTFVNWKGELSSVEGDYTSQAFRQLLAGLKKSGYLATVVNKRVDARAIPVEAPYVVQSGVIKGVHAWILNMKMQITYSGTTGDIGTQVFPVKMVVQRANVDKYPSGIVIRQVIIG